MVCTLGLGRKPSSLAGAGSQGRLPLLWACAAKATTLSTTDVMWALARRLRPSSPALRTRGPRGGQVLKEFTFNS